MANEIILTSTEDVENLLYDYSKNKNIQNSLSNAIKFHLKIFNTINNPQNSASIVDYFIQNYEISLDDVQNEKERKDLSRIFSIQVRGFVNLIYAKYLKDGLQREEKAQELIIDTINNLVDIVPEILSYIPLDYKIMIKNSIDNKTIWQKFKNIFINIYKHISYQSIKAAEEEKFISTLEIIFNKLKDNDDRIGKNRSISDLIKEYKSEIIKFRQNNLIMEHNNKIGHIKRKIFDLFNDWFGGLLIGGTISGIIYLFSNHIYNFLNITLANKPEIFIKILIYIALVIIVPIQYIGGILFIVCMIFPAIQLVRFLIYETELIYYKIKFNSSEKTYLKKQNNFYDDIILKFR